MPYYCDPGTTKGTAVAQTVTRQIVGLAMFEGPRAVAHWGKGFTYHEETHWEKPQFYPDTLRNLRPAQVVALANDLIDLTDAGRATASALAGPSHACVAHRPREWKGQIPKPIHHGRVLGRLSPEELALLVEAYGQPAEALIRYVHTAALAVGKGKKPSYKAEITDLLDAVAFALVGEGRL